MAYQGYLIQIMGANNYGNYVIGKNDTKKFIKASSYSFTMNGQDIDSYRDADGLLHRNALEHSCVKVEFETTPMLTNEEMSTFMSNLRARMTNLAEKKLKIMAYNPETDDYVTAECYMPDIQFSIYGTYNDKVEYNAVRVAFIQY